MSYPMSIIFLQYQIKTSNVGYYRANFHCQCPPNVLCVTYRYITPLQEGEGGGGGGGGEGERVRWGEGVEEERELNLDGGYSLAWYFLRTRRMWEHF